MQKNNRVLTEDLGGKIKKKESFLFCSSFVLNDPSFSMVSPSIRKLHVRHEVGTYRESFKKLNFPLERITLSYSI